MLEIQFNRRDAVKFDVLINEEEDAKLATPVNSEFAGGFCECVTCTNFKQHGGVY